MRRLVTLAVLGMLEAALLVSGAFAQANPAIIVEGQTDKNRQLEKVGGIYINGSDTTGVRLRVTSDGKLILDASQLPQNYTTAPLNLVTAATLAPGGTATSVAATSLGEYTSLLVMVSWNTVAAADSDSVAFGVSFVGKVSTNSNDGFDYLVTSPNDSAWYYRADTTTAFASAWQAGFIGKAPYVFIVSPTKGVMTGAAGAASGGETAAPNAGGNFVYDLYNGASGSLSTRTRPYRLPPNKIVWSDGHNGVCFMLTVPQGQAFKFSHLMAQVINLDRNKTFNNVKVDVWPKVN